MACQAAAQKNTNSKAAATSRFSRSGLSSFTHSSQRGRQAHRRCLRVRAATRIVSVHGLLLQLRLALCFVLHSCMLLVLLQLHKQFVMQTLYALQHNSTSRLDLLHCPHLRTNACSAAVWLSICAMMGRA